MKRRLSLCYSRKRACGCADVHWFGLFGHKYEPCWAICADHIREIVMAGRSAKASAE